MNNGQKKEPDWVFCPLVDDQIEDIDCIENRDIADKMIKEECLPPRFKAKEHWRSICKACKWHEY